MILSQIYKVGGAQKQIKIREVEYFDLELEYLDNYYLSVIDFDVIMS